MRFSALAVRDIASLALGVLVAVTLALRGAGYWALVAQPLTTNVSQMVLSWLMVKWMPGLPQRRLERSFHGGLTGGNVAASYVIVTVIRSADNALVGWYWGAGPLGLYSRAYNLLMLPVRQLSAPAGTVVIPAFSRIQSDKEAVCSILSSHFESYRLDCRASFTGFCSVAAGPVIALVLGAQWKAATPVFQILAISAVGQLLLESTIWIR